MAMLHAHSHAARAPPLDVYTDLPPINNQRVKFTSTAPFTPTYVKDNVTRSSDPAQLYASRVKGRQLLLDNPVRESRTRREREAKKAARLAHRARLEAGLIGKNQVREKGLWKLARSETRFTAFLAIHHLWMDYMSELLALPPTPSTSRQPADAHSMPNSSAMHAKLIKADFHGAIIAVRQSKNPCLVGLSGIIVHETENAFKLVTSKDQLKLVPKRNSIFAFSVPLYARTSLSLMGTLPRNVSTDTVTNLTPLTSPEPSKQTVLDLPHIEFELYGNQFCFRSADRASRKFKHKETIEL